MNCNTHGSFVSLIDGEDDLIITAHKGKWIFRYRPCWQMMINDKYIRKSLLVMLFDDNSNIGVEKEKYVISTISIVSRN